MWRLRALLIVLVAIGCSPGDDDAGTPTTGRPSTTTAPVEDCDARESDYAELVTQTGCVEDPNCVVIELDGDVAARSSASVTLAAELRDDANADGCGFTEACRVGCTGVDLAMYGAECTEGECRVVPSLSCSNEAQLNVRLPTEGECTAPGDCVVRRDLNTCGCNAAFPLEPTQVELDWIELVNGQLAMCVLDRDVCRDCPVSGTLGCSQKGVCVLASRWPNEPAGLDVRLDAALRASTLSAWGTQPPDNGPLRVAVIDAPTAPVSPPSALEFTFGTGLAGGADSSAGSLFANGFGIFSPSTIRFLAFSVQCAANWGSAAGRFVELGAGTENVTVVGLQPNASGEPELVVGSGATSVQWETSQPHAFTCGEWHEVELLQTSDGSSWWLDGDLVGTSTSLPEAGSLAVRLAPLWGADGEVVGADTSLLIDHVRLSIGD